MMSPVDIFAALGERLSRFGRDSESASCIARAVDANPWFTADDILAAVDAIRRQMLDRRKLTEWLAAYRPVSEPKRVALVTAGNIPMVGFFDLLCVIASGNVCYLKPSSKDRVLTDYVVDLLRDIEPRIPICDYDPDGVYDMAIATGGDDANRYFRERFAGVDSLLRGSRHSVAVLSGNETEAEQRALVRDITMYSGLGCRSVSLVFMPRGYRFEPAAGPCANRKLHNNYLSARALMSMQGRAFVDCGAFLCIEQRSFPATLSCIAISYYDDISQVADWLAEHDGEIQCVVSDVVAHTRRVPLGMAQYPTLRDYADEKDTMSFLTCNRAR